MAFVSVVIPVYNASATLGAQLEALTNQDYTGDFEVILADNRSTDRLGEVVARFLTRLPGFRVVEAFERPGISYTRNIGTRAATGDLILGCDSDDVVLSGWMSGLVDALSRFDIVGGWFDEETLNPSAVRSWHEPRSKTALKRPYGWLEAFVGANYGFHRRVFDSIDGWNEAYVTLEDIEFSWRAQLAGFTIGFSPTACVQYRYRPSLSALARQEYSRARSSPRLHDEFRPHGYAPPAASSRAAGTVRWLVGNIPAAVMDRGTRGRWVRRAAYSASWAVARVRE